MYGEYVFSAIGSWLSFRESVKDLRTKIVLHSLGEVICHQAFTQRIFHQLYKVLGLPI